MATNTQHTSANDDLVGRFMTFYIGDALYGIELLYVKEIVSLQQTTVVPSLPHYILGIMNLRGKVVPLIDVRLKLNQPERPYDDKTCVIITLIEDMQRRYSPPATPKRSSRPIRLPWVKTISTRLCTWKTRSFCALTATSFSRTTCIFN